MNKRKQIKQTKRWVIKIGSALLTNDGMGLNTTGIADWVKQMVVLSELGIELVLVSSGAVAEGLCRLGWKKRPDSLHELQAAAAVGQMGLVQAYESQFSLYARRTAQILLTHDDLSNRQRYLNARSTVRSLLKLGVIPVINENDSVVTDEIRFGDNDTLAALVANLIEADLLIILTDQNGLFDRDPRQHQDAKLIQEASVNDQTLEAMADIGADNGADGGVNNRVNSRVNNGAGVLGRGGMTTKIRAARLAARSGTSTIIASGRVENILTILQKGGAVGTLLYAEEHPETARKQWLAGHLQIKGTLILDQGAVKKLQQAGSSLLAVGVTEVKGNFSRGEMVSCVSLSGNEIARGLVNYAANEVRIIKGQPSEKIESILGYVDEAELIHRDNLVLV